MFRSGTEDEIQAKATVNATVANYVNLSNDLGGAFRQIKLTLRSCPLAITDALAYGSVLLLTLPEGYVTLLGAVAKNLTFTTTSAISTTLNSGVTVQFALGTAAASATTLAGTMLNVCPGVDQPPPTFVSSTVINTAPALVSERLRDIDMLDGSAAAIPVYLNIAVLTGGDIDGDATLLVDGTIILTFLMTGDA